MDGDTEYDKVEDVVGCHVEDAVTFWGQSVSKCDDLLKLSCVLAEACPQANAVFGRPDFTRIYGGCFSEDRCWYRCIVQQEINSEKCQVLYIDYGNSEILNRSDIVEIPPNLQYPSVAKKYRLWGLQIPTNQNLDTFDLGMKFLNSLVFEKEIKICHKGKQEDGTIIAQAEHEKIDIGEEVAKAGFAEKCLSPGNTEDVEGSKVDVIQKQCRKTKAAVSLWLNRSNHALHSTPQERFDQATAGRKNWNFTGNPLFFPKREKMLAASPSMSDTRLAQVRAGRKQSKEREALRKENLLQRQELDLELNIRQLQYELQREKKASRETAEIFEETLRTYVGTTMRSLVVKVKALKEVRRENKDNSFEEQLSQAMKVVTEGCITVPCSLENLQKIWTEYDLAQERIQLCRNVKGAGAAYSAIRELRLTDEKRGVIRNCPECRDERDELITKRDEVQQNLYSAVKEFILEVDQLPLSERSRTLQELSSSMEMVYSQGSEADHSEEVFQQFSEWKSIKMKKLIHVRRDTDTALQSLADWFGGILKTDSVCALQGDSSVMYGVSPNLQTGGRGGSLMVVNTAKAEVLFQCFDLTSESSSDLEVVGNADEILKKVELAFCEELDTNLNGHDEAEKGLMMRVYSTVKHKVCQEQSMIAVIQNRYLASVEFKKHSEEWLNRRPDISNLLSIKKTVKSLKAQLRWKLVEKNNFEESDDYSEFEMTRIKEGIADLRNRIFQEISKEQEEYEMLSYLVQKWFPELPLLYPEGGILSYMNSGGLLTCSLERDLLDAEPVKELSTKRPLLCSEIEGQKVLLKGYFVDVSSEAKVIEEVVKYHKAWDQQKEKSGLLQLLFLLFCKSDPLVYLMVPYYPGASLKALQADTPLTLGEALKVMKGVAQGLQALHGANIVHGSLHGNNVFAVNRKQGIVGDFDFTKSEEQRAAANTMVIGTLSLVSPELKMGHPASPASDMYAYGCLLLWLCVEKQEFVIKEDGTPEVDVIVMDDKVRSLLLNLFCCSRLTAEQVLRDDCFCIADVIPALPGCGEEHELWEERGSKKTDEEKKAEENGAKPAQ